MVAVGALQGPRGVRVNCTVWAVAAALLSLTACGGDVGSAPEQEMGFVARDSAGIRIVENHGPAWAEPEGWSLGAEPLFILHGFDGGPENRLLDPTSIDVDSRGRIIVGDGNQAGWHAVLVYDSLGRFQFQAGRDGQGPGEFGQLWWASSYRGDSILAFDMSGDRLSVFSPEGIFARTTRVPALQVERGPPGTSYTAGADMAYGDGYFLAYPRGTLDIESGPGPVWLQHLLLRLSPDGAAWDTLGTFGIYQQYWSGTNQEQLWFAPIAVTAVGSDELYFGRGDSFEIGRYDSRGRLTRLIRRAHEPRPVTEELRGLLRDWYEDLMRGSREVNDRMLEQIAEVFESARFAETLPPYSAILLDDDGYLWVEEFRWINSTERRPVPRATQWSVFRPDGVWLGNVETPAGFILRKVTAGRALGFVVDEFDVKEIHVYALDRGFE